MRDQLQVVGPSGLTYRELVFAKAYIATCFAGRPNAREAMLTAGAISPESADGIAHKFLKKPKVKAYIDKALMEHMAVLDQSADRVLMEVAKLANSNMNDYLRIDADGHPHIDLSELNPQLGAAIQEVTVDEYTEGKGEDKREVKRVRLKLHDKRGSLELLGKYHKLWTDKHELTGPGGTPLQAPVLEVNFVDGDPDDQQPPAAAPPAEKS